MKDAWATSGISKLEAYGEKKKDMEKIQLQKYIHLPFCTFYFERGGYE